MIKRTEEALVGDVDEEITYVSCLAAALRLYCWNVDILTCDVSTMRKQLINIAKRQHEQSNRNLSPSDRPPFDMETVTEVDDNSIFVVGCTIFTVFGTHVQTFSMGFVLWI